jgi:hypothetical protein
MGGAVGGESRYENNTVSSNCIVFGMSIISCW